MGEEQKDIDRRKTFARNFEGINVTLLYQFSEHLPLPSTPTMPED